MKWWILVLLVVLGGLGYGVYKVYPYYRMFQLRDARAMDIAPDEKADVFIPTGATLADVAQMLAKKKLIHTPEDFLFLAKAKRYEGRRVVAGRYRVHGDMSYNSLINHLRAGRGRRAVKVSFHYLKGLEDLAQKVGRAIEPSPAALLKAFRSPEIHRLAGLPYREFPTLFLTDTYRVHWNCSPACFVRRMKRAYRRFWRGTNEAKAKALGLSRFEVAILASIVQAEQSKRPDEWPKIAGLYLNRLRRGIKLQADPTVKYALKKPGLRRVLLKHLKVPSPYNTYLHKGLPPGPINWPEKRALLAVLNYRRHKYIYMCAKPGYSGYHSFAVTARQHERNARRYHRWLNKQGIR